jgi:hypothetical protein
MSTERLLMVAVFMVMSCSWKSVDVLLEVTVEVLVGVLMSRSVMSGAFVGWNGSGTEKRKKAAGSEPGGLEVS